LTSWVAESVCFAIGYLCGISVINISQGLAWAGNHMEK
jgi:hypothetical protein